MGGAARPDAVRHAFFVPETADTYRPFGCWTTPKGRAPAWLKRAAILAFVRPVAEQDRIALEKQHDAIAAFGAPKFKSGPTDLVHAALSQFYADGVAAVRPPEKSIDLALIFALSGGPAHRQTDDAEDSNRHRWRRRRWARTRGQARRAFWARKARHHSGRKEPHPHLEAIAARGRRRLA